MPLEATVVCLDGSEYMRNGDYTPNRLDAMKDCASLLVDAKFAMNPESSVGVVASGFALGPKALCSCSSVESAVNPLNACSSLHVQNNDNNNNDNKNSSSFPFCATLQVAALTLKHRRNKNGQARIVLFCGSPIGDAEQDMVKLGKNLKKNNVAVDVVSLDGGGGDGNEHKLAAFMDAVQKNDLCTLVVCPVGVLVSDCVTNSPVFQGQGGGGGGGGGEQEERAPAAGGFAEYGGVDPSLDPEMALALRASMEEERARLAAAAPAVPAAQDNDEEAMLAEAILLSMRGEEEEEAAAPPAKKQEDEDDDDDDDDEARQLALAMALSQQEEEAEEKPPASFLDPAYVNQLLEGLEGIDKNDPALLALLQQQPDNKKAKKDDKEEDSASNNKKPKKDEE